MAKTYNELENTFHSATKGQSFVQKLPDKGLNEVCQQLNTNALLWSMVKLNRLIMVWNSEMVWLLLISNGGIYRCLRGQK